MRYFSIAIAFVFLPEITLAQGERLGTIAGTWEACNEAVQPLRKSVNQAENEAKTPPQVLTFVRHRLAVELDRCAKLADTPLAEHIELMSRYQQLGMDDRALEIGLRADQQIRGSLDLALQIAKLFYKRGVMGRAIPMLKAIVNARPNDVDANQLLGAYYYQRHELKEAVSFLHVVAEARTQSFEANAALGDTCLQINDLACAGEFLGKASALNPSDVLLAVKLGDLERTRGEFGNALAAYERALEVSPKRLDARLGLGRTYTAAKLYENAQLEYRTAIDLAPNNPTPILELARAMRGAGRPLGGIYILETSFLKTQRSPQRELEYTLSLIAANKANEARAHLQTLSNNLRNQDAFIAADGDALLALGQKNKALDMYRRARGLRDTPEYAIREARALRLMNQREQARDLLRQANGTFGARVAQEAVANLEDLAFIEAGRRNIDRALEHLREAITAMPTNPTLYIAQTALLAATTTTTAMDPVLAELPTAKPTLAYIAYLRGDYSTTTQLLRQPHTRHPSTRDPSGQLLRAVALAKNKQTDDAITSLESLTSQPQGERDPAIAPWLGFSVATSIHNALTKNNFTRVETLHHQYAAVQSTYKNLIIQAGMVATLAQGKPLDAQPLTTRNKSSTLDAILFALNERANKKPETGLEHLRDESDKLQEVQKVRDTLRMELSAKLFVAKKGREAAKVAKETRVSSTWPGAQQFNRDVILNVDNRNPKGLENRLDTYIVDKLPEAYFNKAILVDQQNTTGEGSIPWLAQLMELPGPAALKTRAEKLLTLKKRLYQ